MPLRLGAYVRVSTEEQAVAVDGSLENQKYRLKAFVDLKNTQVKNWASIVEYYIDDGYSAKDTRRPAYQKMLQDLKKKKIDLILVADLSRLSRNIYDFCTLMDDLEKYGAQFLSIKEQFDSTTPAGKMMIYNMINLAQFEREQISERVSLGVHARAMRGLMNGARPILGYDKSKDKPGQYVVNEDEAKDVRKIFNYYLECGSLSKTLKMIETDAIQTKKLENSKSESSSKWSCQTIHYLLSSAAYIGLLEVNKKNKSKDQSKLKPFKQYKQVKASWPKIVSEEKFWQVQELLKSAQLAQRERLDNSEFRNYLLSGILRCGECGTPLVGQTAHGEKSVHRYYGHTAANRNKGCQLSRFDANAIEEKVVQYINSAIVDAGYFKRLELKLKEKDGVRHLDLKREKTLIEKSLRDVQIKLDNLLLMQSTASGEKALQYVMKSFESLHHERQQLEDRLSDLSDSATVSESIHHALSSVKESLELFKRGFAKATGATKKRLLRKLLKQLVITPEGLHIFMNFAHDELAPQRQLELIRVKDQKGSEKSEFLLKKKGSNEQVLRSSIIKHGDSGTTRTCDLLLRRFMVYPPEPISNVISMTCQCEKRPDVGPVRIF